MGPVLIVVVHQKGYPRVLQDVADAAQADKGCAFGLLVQDDVNDGPFVGLAQGKAHGYYVGLAGGGRGGKAAHRSSGQAPGLPR